MIHTRSNSLFWLAPEEQSIKANILSWSTIEFVGYGVIKHGFFSRGFVSLIYVDTADRRRLMGSGLFDEFEGRAGVVASLLPRSCRVC